MSRLYPVLSLAVLTLTIGVAWPAISQSLGHYHGNTLDGNVVKFTVVPGSAGGLAIGAEGVGVTALCPDGSTRIQYTAWKYPIPAAITNGSVTHEFTLGSFINKYKMTFSGSGATATGVITTLIKTTSTAKWFHSSTMRCRSGPQKMSLNYRF